MFLTTEQKQHSVTDLCQQAWDDPTFTSRIITGDKSWVYGYDLDTKQQSLQWRVCSLAC